jgi:tRNA 2-thiouridine synthesizing protein D
MLFAIQINDSPARSDTSMTGFQLIKAALTAGHQIVRVFFYHDGIYNAFMPALPGEMVPPDWSSLARESRVELIFCTAAAERRGMLQTDREPGAGLSPLEGFQGGGLGLWVDACIRAERVVVFGGG